MLELKRLLTVRELAQYMGSTPKTIYTKKSRGKIPCKCIVKIGDSIRFDLSEINKWIDSLKRKTLLS